MAPRRQKSRDDEMRREGQGRRRRVVVVGAGVSGCACAAVLAANGVLVTVVNGSLDAVGLPGYGPVVVGRSGALRDALEAIRALPDALRAAWVTAGRVPEGESGYPYICLDRRLLSIETKRALEGMSGLEFRQGLVTDVRLGGVKGERRSESDAPGWAVWGTTAFGEELGGDALVLAVGLGVEGRVHVEDGDVEGGRYGETAGWGLREALGRLGVEFGEALVEVGPRVAVTGWSGGMEESAGGWSVGRMGKVTVRVVGVRPLGEVGRRTMQSPRDSGDGDPWAGTRWAREYPPSPYWAGDFDAGGVVLVGAEEGCAEVFASPDGVATGEMYFAPGALEMVEGRKRSGPEPPDAGAGGEMMANDGRSGVSGGGPLGSMAIRLRHTAEGLVVGNAGPAGRLTVSDGKPAPVWVTGRLGGATNYVESLEAGVRTGGEVTRALRRESAAEQGM